MQNNLKSTYVFECNTFGKPAYNKASDLFILLHIESEKPAIFVYNNYYKHSYCNRDSNI